MRRFLALLLSVALGSLGCASVRTDYDPEVDFSGYQTFAWLDPPVLEEPRPDASLADPFTYNSLLDKRVRADAEAALVARGYRKAAEGEQPDFHLRYDILTREVVRDYPVFVGGGYYGRHGYYGDVGYYRSSSYEEGTVILDVIDPGSQSIVWRGWAHSSTYDGHISADRLSRVVNDILARFPPQPRRSAPAPPAG
jgi:hypothetical protein